MHGDGDLVLATLTLTPDPDPDPGPGPDPGPTPNRDPDPNPAPNPDPAPDLPLWNQVLRTARYVFVIFPRKFLPFYLSYDILYDPLKEHNPYSTTMSLFGQGALSSRDKDLVSIIKKITHPGGIYINTAVREICRVAEQDVGRNHRPITVIG